MILKSVQKNNENEEKKGKKINMKLSVITTIILFLSIVIIVLFKVLNNHEKIYIEVVPDNLILTFGPNTYSEIITKLNKTGKVNIITPNNIKGIKCYSNNEEVISFKNNTVFISKGVGESNIFCSKINGKSNVVKVKVVE